MRRRDVLGLGVGGAVAALLTGFPEPARAGVPLKILRKEGFVAVPLSGGGNDLDGVAPANPAPEDAADLQSQLLRDLYHTCIGRGKPATSIEVIQPFFQNLLARQAAAAASGPGVSVAVLVADVYAPDLLHEATVFKLGIGGNTYSNKPSKHTTRSVGHGYTVRISHTPSPSDDELEGFLFVAVVKLVQFPDRGLVVLGVLDTNLAANLESNGIVNADASGTEITIPFSLNLVGNSSGNHRATSSFDALYYAVQDQYGIAGPADEADEVQTFLGDVTSA